MRQRIRSHLTYANVVATLSLFIVLGGMSYAATGGNFILGKSNSASSKTSLSAPIADKALALSNTSTAAGATALGLNVASGHAPFTVNSGTKVANLNADELDGIDSGAFQRRVTGTCANGRAISSIATDGTVGCADQGTNLWARATFYQGGTILSNTGNGIVTYAGSTGHYLVTFPQSVVDCAAVVTANEGNNSGWVALYETANVAKDPGGDPNTLAVSLMDAFHGGFVNDYGFNISVSC